MAADGQPRVGVIGGSGLYELFTGSELVPVETPFGPPSDPVVVGEVDGRAVAFLPRHGVDHRYPPHRIPYRANLWALRAVGVRQVLAPCAVGSLRADAPAGTLVIPDQLVDRTSGRAQTYYDNGAVHVSFADPYCPVGRALAVSSAQDAGWRVVDGGTTVVVEGPRFSTRAESQHYAANGWTVVNMTGHPEAVLARELALCYTSLALVTDLDAGVSAEEAVAQHDVFAELARNTDRLRTLLATLIGRLPEQRQDCRCEHALDGLPVPFPLP